MIFYQLPLLSWSKVFTSFENRLSHLLAAQIVCLVSLPSETAALGQTGLATSWSTQDGAAVSAGYNCLAVAEDCGDVEAPLALDVHEVAVG